MKLRGIPTPVLTPFSGKKAESKPKVAVVVPKPPTEVSEPAHTDEKPRRRRRAPAAAEKSIEADAVLDQPEAALEDEPLAVLEDGTKVPKPYKEVDPLTALSSPNPTLALLLLRQLRDMKGPMPDSTQGALGLLIRLEEAIRSGKDISGLKEEVSTLLMGGDERDELFLRMVDEVDRERAQRMLESRSKFEDLCHAASRRGDLNVVEGMAATAYFNTQLTGIISRIEKKQRGGEGNNTRDTGDLINRVNRPTLIQNKELEKKFDAASPQEREIIRKMGFRLQNALAARITTTTKTETKTVEVVQANEPGET
jgi:hypothetical protein